MVCVRVLMMMRMLRVLVWLTRSSLLLRVLRIWMTVMMMRVGRVMMRCCRIASRRVRALQWRISVAQDRRDLQTGRWMDTIYL